MARVSGYTDARMLAVHTSPIESDQSDGLRVRLERSKVTYKFVMKLFISM